MYLTKLYKSKIMQDNKILSYIKDVLENMPASWLNLTTHRLDIYDEKLAKIQFLDRFDTLFDDNNSDSLALNELPTAYDYIRLGHPLSSILEWVIGKFNNLKSDNVISFSSNTMPVLAILRKNLLDHKNTQVFYTDAVPDFFDVEILRNVYGYQFDLKQIENVTEIPEFQGSTIFISQQDTIGAMDLNPNIDFYGSPTSQLTTNTYLVFLSLNIRYFNLFGHKVILFEHYVHQSHFKQVC